MRSINERKKNRAETLVPEPVKPQSNECPYIEPLKNRVIALELNYSAATSRIADLGELLKEQRKSMEDASVMADNKLDIVLAELKEFRTSVEDKMGDFRERLAKTEANIQNIKDQLPSRGRGRGD